MGGDPFPERLHPHGQQLKHRPHIGVHQRALSALPQALILCRSSIASARAEGLIEDRSKLARRQSVIGQWSAKGFREVRRQLRPVRVLDPQWVSLLRRSRPHMDMFAAAAGEKVLARTLGPFIASE